MGAPVDRPRVIFVEDDVSVRRFVALALEDMDIELVECSTVEAALAALHERPARLVVTDLMLPGEPGLSLVQRLAREPLLAGGARVAVFSAGVNAEMRAQLERLGVWRILLKPASLASLQECVGEGVSSDAWPATPRHDGPLAPAHDSSEAALIASFFEGDRQLFLEYKAACLAQFPRDICAGDAACAAADAPALERLGHSLKTVLRSIGDERSADVAALVERAAASGAMQQACTQWAALRLALQTLTCGSR